MQYNCICCNKDPVKVSAHVNAISQRLASSDGRVRHRAAVELRILNDKTVGGGDELRKPYVKVMHEALYELATLKQIEGRLGAAEGCLELGRSIYLDDFQVASLYKVIYVLFDAGPGDLPLLEIASKALMEIVHKGMLFEILEAETSRVLEWMSSRPDRIMAACHVLRGLLSEPDAPYGTSNQKIGKSARKIDVLIIMHIADLLKQLWGAIKRTDDKTEVSLISHCIGYLIHSSVRGDPACGVQRVETFCGALLMSINANLVSNAKGSERVITAMAHLVDFLPEKLINVTVAAALSAPPTPPLARLISKIMQSGPSKFAGLSGAAIDFCLQILEKKTTTVNGLGQVQRNSMITPGTRISLSTMASEAKSAAPESRKNNNNSMLIPTDFALLDDTPTLHSLHKVVKSISKTPEGVQAIKDRIPRLRACTEFNGTLAAVKLASAFCTFDPTVNISTSIKTVLHLGKNSGKRGRILREYGLVSEEAMSTVTNAILPEIISDLEAEGQDAKVILKVIEDICDFVTLDSLSDKLCDLLVGLCSHSSTDVRHQALCSLLSIVFTTFHESGPRQHEMQNQNSPGSRSPTPTSPGSSGIHFGADGGTSKQTPIAVSKSSTAGTLEIGRFGSLAVSPVPGRTSSPTPPSRSHVDTGNHVCCEGLSHRREVLEKTLKAALSDTDTDIRISLMQWLMPTGIDPNKDIRTHILRTSSLAVLVFQVSRSDSSEEVRELASNVLSTCKLQDFIPEYERMVSLESLTATFSYHPNPHIRQAAVLHLSNLLSPETDVELAMRVLPLLSDSLDASGVEPGSLLLQSILVGVAKITKTVLHCPPDLVHKLSLIVQQHGVSQCTEPALESVGNVLQNMAGQDDTDTNPVLQTFSSHTGLYPLAVTMSKGRTDTYPLGVIQQAMRLVGILGAANPRILNSLQTDTKQDVSMYDFSSAWSTVTVLLDVLVQPWNSLHHDKVLQALASVLKVLGRSRSLSQIPRIIPVLTHLLQSKTNSLKSGGKCPCQVLLHVLAYVISLLGSDSNIDYHGDLLRLLIEIWNLSSDSLRNITTFGASQAYMKALSVYSNELASIISLLCDPVFRESVDLKIYIPLFGHAAVSLDKSGERVISIKFASAMSSLGEYMQQPENIVQSNLATDALLSILSCCESTSYVKALVVKALQAILTKETSTKISQGVLLHLSEAILREQAKDGNDSSSLSQHTVVKWHSSFNSSSSVLSSGRHDLGSHYQSDAVIFLSSVSEKFPSEVGFLQPRVNYLLQHLVTVPEPQPVSEPLQTLSGSSGSRPQQNDALNIKEIDVQYIRSALQVDHTSSNSGTTFDYSLWFDKLCLTLLKESTRPVLRAVTGVAAALPAVARKLFCIAFATVYRDLHVDQPKITHNMILCVQTVLQSQSDAHVPEDILRILLELCDFMERVLLRNERLKSSSLPSFMFSKPGNSVILKADIAILAEGSGLYTQALRLAECCDITNATTYRQLIRLNRILGLPEASEGIMKMVRKGDIKDADMYADLGLWEEAYHRYKFQLKNGSKQEERCISGMIQSLHHQGEWQKMLDTMDQHSSALSSEAHAQLGSVIIHGAWILQRWDVVSRSLESGTLDYPLDKLDNTSHHSFHHSFYSSLLAVREHRTNDAHRSIAECRESLIGTQHDTLIQLQHLVELEEILRFRDNIPHLRQIWSTRYQTMRSLADVQEYYDTLTLRTLALPMRSYPDPWVDFCRKQLSKGNIDIARKAVAALEAELGTGTKIISPKCELVKCEVSWEYQQPAAARFQIVTTLAELVDTYSPYRRNTVCDRHTYDMMCLRLGHWRSELGFPLNQVLEPLKAAINHNEPSESSELWLQWGLLNLRAVHRGYVTDAKSDLKWSHISQSVIALSKSMQLDTGPQSAVTEMQTALRLLHIAVTYLPDERCPDTVKNCISKSCLLVQTSTWRGLIPQLVSQLGKNPPRGSHLEKLILTIAKSVAGRYPQQVLVRVLVNKGDCPGEADVISVIRESFPMLSSQLITMTNELKELTRLPEERWVSALSSVHRKFVSHDSCKAVIATIQPIYDDPYLLNAFPEHRELFDSALEELYRWRDTIPFASNLHRSRAKQMFMTLWRKLHALISTSLQLKQVSKCLSTATDLEVEIPTRKAESGGGGVRIARFDDTVPIIPSVQRPRRVTMIGTNGESYRFLLKRNEDLRLDERIMQLLMMANSLNLPINTFVYNVVPIASDVGLIEWVDEAEDLDAVISQTRPRNQRDQELSLLKARTLTNTSFLSCRSKDFSWEGLSHAQRVDCLSYLENHIPAETLQIALWTKAASTQIWHKRRTSFTLSVAVMSIVGFLIGLGDRHLGNILLHNSSGRVVHIDFGECFEAAMLRTTYPETVPFRLTRELRHAMGVGGIEGVFRAAAVQTLLKLRTHKQAVLAMLESFMHEPCIKQTGRLAEPSFILQRVCDKLEGTDELTDPSAHLLCTRNSEESATAPYPHIMYSPLQEVQISYPETVYKVTRTDVVCDGVDGDSEADHYPTRLYSVKSSDCSRSGVTPSQQVNRLINAATSLDNLATLYKGWKPWL
eukprot:TRINITY_DN4304_c0_g1_i1.p1 TRINITY_DN4304_c0_g1~~TRINITY_DN4304_c0_g1_i1.p1  ORF type:complete len:2551 (+),score=337.62 TRINITY_DN4304_c0_g1_i1:51-7703(+)